MFKKINNATKVIVLFIILVLLLSVVSNLDIWNASTRSDNLSEAFEKSRNKGQIVNTVENDDIAVIVALESQQKGYYTFKKEDGKYTLRNNAFKSIFTDTTSREGQLQSIIKYKCPKSDYIYVEVEIDGIDPEEEMRVFDSENRELPFYSKQYDSGYKVNELRSFYALVPENEEYSVFIDGEEYVIID